MTLTSARAVASSKIFAGSVESVVTEELAGLREAGWYVDHLDVARDLFVATAVDDEFVDFLTLPAYAEVVRAGE